MSFPQDIAQWFNRASSVSFMITWMCTEGPEISSRHQFEWRRRTRSIVEWTLISFMMCQQRFSVWSSTDPLTVTQTQDDLCLSVTQFSNDHHKPVSHVRKGIWGLKKDIHLLNCPFLLLTQTTEPSPFIILFNCLDMNRKCNGLLLLWSWTWGSSIKKESSPVSTDIRYGLIVQRSLKTIIISLFISNKREREWEIHLLVKLQKSVLSQWCLTLLRRVYISN